ncbi:CAP domain-containing protein [Companilactobacillus kedongensis]|uniref:CAP domain-containing protein n=1 Tax=Companilactobacillus kedongensis TaxID=2486004 RepID=UPI000F7AA7E2|nr:CAP domain-containing protein [Companilactobacillus kedongensis]
MGLNPQRVDPLLVESSQVRAEEAIDAYSHDRPDGRGWDTSIGDGTLEALDFSVDENLTTLGYIDGSSLGDTAEGAWTGFLSDQGHAMPLVTNKFTRIGVGVSKNAGGTGYYVVEHFASEPY